MKSLVRLLLDLWRPPSTGVEDRRALFTVAAATPTPPPIIDIETLLREGRY